MRSILVLLLAATTPAAAQETVQPLLTIGGDAEDRLRIAQVRGDAATDGFLLRSFSTLNPAGADGSTGPRIDFIGPDLRVIRNSGHAYSLNEGSLWAGRGWNARFMSGIRIASGPMILVAAPQFALMENRDVAVLPSADPGRSVYASPWHTGEHSMDLPTRYGNQRLTTFDPGQSSLTIRANPLAFGIATENQWWGPGIRNAIVMSNNAPGFPHLFLRTARPLSVGLGTLEVKWIVGTLTESLFFDADDDNDHRSLSGVVVTLAPGTGDDLTLGVARSVVAPASSAVSAPGRAFDVFTRWGDSSGADHLTSLFVRWIFPADGFEAYAEWSRLEEPRSLRSFLAAPHHTQGYTLGVQWVRPTRDADLFRIQGEITYLEQTPAFRQVETRTYYAGRHVEHGYTQRGQVIGAAIGPGASSQWLGADYLAPGWRIGLVGGRIRWNNDAYYRQQTGFSFFSHDVSVFGGLRAARLVLGSDMAFGLTAGHRYNYLFQNHHGGWGRSSVHDRRNWTLEMSVTPRGAASGTRQRTAR